MLDRVGPPRKLDFRPKSKRFAQGCRGRWLHSAAPERDRHSTFGVVDSRVEDGSLSDELCHQHHGFTLGPASGRLLAEIMTGEPRFADPSPFAAERFA